MDHHNITRRNTYSEASEFSTYPFNLTRTCMTFPFLHEQNTDCTIHVVETQICCVDSVVIEFSLAAAANKRSKQKLLPLSHQISSKAPCKNTALLNLFDGLERKYIGSCLVKRENILALPSMGSRSSYNKKQCGQYLYNSGKGFMFTWTSTDRLKVKP